MKKLLTLWALVCLLAAPTAQAHWPESRLHPHLTFEGIPLPDHSTKGREPAQIGLYVGRGSWETGKEHLKLFFRDRGFSYRSFTTAQILAGELEESGVQVLVMPGGESWTYLKDLGTEGATKIRDFVSAGGGYIGICAGAFYATSYRKGGVATGAYGIGLLDGTAYDGTFLHTAPFKEGMLDFPMTSSPLLSGLKSLYRILLLGGPSLRYTAEEADKKNIEVLGYFEDIYEPAMAVFQYGEGRVFLSGPHLEVEESKTNWGPEYHDPESDWPLLERVTRYVLKEE